ncbi:hypothetical protein L7F22_057531 [Adiantum nelumboides]|nr:hypothetical protein [Adiantum nelumboides]
MTRWVEAQSVTRVNEKTVSRFIYTHICCRFDTPLEIFSDDGSGFRKGLLTEVCEELHILHRHSTPYYPQSNGLVEKANGIIARITRKMVKNKTKLWDDFLDGALWAYRTTYNKGIKEGDLVLRYDNRLDNRFDAKFETRWQGPYIVKKAFNSSYYQLMDLDEKEHPRKANGYQLKPYLSRILPKDLQDQRQKATLSHKSCSLVQVSTSSQDDKA